MMTLSQSTTELFKALAKAQGEIENAKKDQDNPFYKSKYADLAGVRDVCRGPLAANGLAVIQLPTTTCEGKCALTYMLIHSSGEYIGDCVEINPVKNDPQNVIAAFTYFRRTTLAALVGVATEDDDGNTATDLKKPEEKISFKKSVTPNPGQAKPRVDIVQKGNSFVAAEVIDKPAAAEPDRKPLPPAAADASLVDQLEKSIAMVHDTDPEPEYITLAQQGDLLAECRRVSPHLTGPMRKNHLHVWLYDHGYYDKDGNATLTKIKTKSLENVTHELTKWISEQ